MGNREKIPTRYRYIYPLKRTSFTTSMPLTVVSRRLMSDSEVKAFDDMMQEAAKKYLGLDVS